MKISHSDANGLHGWSISAHSPYKDIRFTHAVKLKELVKTDDYARSGYLVEVHFVY